ncbi:MAG: GAF domain-containing protein [Chloroflexota bacterium]
MLTNFLTLFRPIRPYDNPLTEQRAQGLLIYLVSAFFIAIIASIFVGLQGLERVSIGGSFLTPSDLVAYSSPFFVIVFWWTVRQGYYRVGAVGVVILSLIYVYSLWNSELPNGTTITYTIPIIMAGLLLGWRVMGIISLLVVGAIAGPTLVNNDAPSQFLGITLALSVVGTLIVTFGTSVQLIATRFIREATNVLEVMQTVVAATDTNDEAQVILQTLNIIRDQLGYTFARVYMVDSSEIVRRMQSGLNLREITVDTDIRLGQRNALYDAINQQKIIKITSSSDEAVRQHLLSSTRFALAVPVFDSRQNVIAVLDIQSDNLDNVTTTALQTIELVSQQIGQALGRIQQMNRLRRDLLEQDELLERQREQLLQYERAEQRITTDTWRDYLTQQGVDYLGYDLNIQDTSPIEAITMTPEIESAIQTGEIYITQDEDMQIVSVPISLRGQSLGAMTFRVPIGTQVIGARQQELIRNVVQRLSLALENKRLFEQSQSQATREATANQVGNVLFSSTDINDVLKLAADNFNEALGAVQTQIRLRPDAQFANEHEGQS